MNLSFTPAQADELFRKYPYFVVPAVKALRKAAGEERKELCRRIAAAVGDRAALRAVLGIDPEEFAAFYPDMDKTRLSTEATIDSFLDRFAPDAAKAAKEADMQEAIPIAPPAVYDITDLEDTEPVDNGDLNTLEDDTSKMLSGFLEKVPPKTPTRKTESDSARKPEPKPVATSSSLSESLAKVMIKNGNYQKALEIITELSLNNPKKSIYFADQIRFLKKLILNQSRQSK